MTGGDGPDRKDAADRGSHFVATKRVPLPIWSRAEAVPSPHTRSPAGRDVAEALVRLFRKFNRIRMAQTLHFVPNRIVFERPPPGPPPAR